jgi:hypothetical protein
MATLTPHHATHARTLHAGTGVGEVPPLTVLGP